MSSDYLNAYQSLVEYPEKISYTKISKVSSIRHKFNLQKLANRAVHLYLTDEEFRKKLHNHTDLTISGSL